MVETKKFQRTKEDFVCANCGAEVAGTGYTNHCPECLWSRHVDINPGDRAESCHGLMRPVALAIDHGSEYLVHVCQNCGFERRNKLAKNDNYEAALEVAKGRIC